MEPQDPLVLEISPNGIQWYKAPQYLELYEYPQVIRDFKNTVFTFLRAILRFFERFMVS